MEDLRIPTVSRKRKVTLSVNGREITAYEGETVFAALQAAGYRVFNRNGRTGRVCGGLCGMGICYGCLVSINGVTNQRSCMIDVEEDMEVTLDET